MTYDKCNTKDTLCDDHDDTYETMLKNLGMSATDVYMVRSNHLHKDKPLKTPKKTYTHCATTNMQKYNIFSFLAKGTKTSQENTWTGLQCLRRQCRRPRKAPKLRVGKIFGGCCSNNNKRF